LAVKKYVDHFYKLNQKESTWAISVGLTYGFFLFQRLKSNVTVVFGAMAAHLFA